MWVTYILDQDSARKGFAPEGNSLGGLTPHRHAARLTREALLSVDSVPAAIAC